MESVPSSVKVTKIWFLSQKLIMINPHCFLLMSRQLRVGTKYLTQSAAYTPKFGQTVCKLHLKHMEALLWFSICSFLIRVWSEWMAVCILCIPPNPLYPIPWKFCSSGKARRATSSGDIWYLWTVPQAGRSGPGSLKIFRDEIRLDGGGIYPQRSVWSRYNLLGFSSFGCCTICPI